MSYFFTIKGRLPGLNEIIAATNRNRFVGASLKKQATTLCAQYAQLARLPKITRPVEISVNWIEPNARRDLDNISGGTKFILDGLVMIGVLQNDTRKWVRAISHKFPEPDKKNPRIEVTLNQHP